MSEPPWKRRTQSRYVCDQCGDDYCDEPDLCVTILDERHPKYSETVCRKCVRRLGYTGYRVVRLPNGARHGLEYVLGTDQPPRGWSGRRPTADELLRYVAGVGYLRPKPVRQLESLDVEGELERLARVVLSTAGVRDES